MPSPAIPLEHEARLGEPMELRFAPKNVFGRSSSPSHVSNADVVGPVSAQGTQAESVPDAIPTPSSAPPYVATWTPVAAVGSAPSQCASSSSTSWRTAGVSGTA